MMTVDPFADIAVVVAVSVIVEPVGARSGTFSQLTVASARAATPSPKTVRRENGNIGSLSILLPCSYAVNTVTRW
jgi:hypothetical protein